MRTHSINLKGMTLVEVMFATLIMGFMSLVLYSIAIAAMNTEKASQVESDLYLQGSMMIERIQVGEQGLYGIMKSRANSIAVSDDATQIDFSVDTNEDYTTDEDDDTNMSLYTDDGDLDPMTLEDNLLVFDPDTNVDDDEIILGTNVESVAFDFDGDKVTVDLSLTERIKGNARSINVSREIWVRN
jgi:type II secretory pathway pseudopilin PulG